MSNNLDPDQAGHFFGPDLGPNCSQRLSADDTKVGKESSTKTILEMIFFFVCLFDLILNVQVNIFQSCRDRFS